MATGRIWVRIFNTYTQLEGLPQKPEPRLFIKRVFFLTPNPPRRASADLVPSYLAKPKIRNTNFDLWFSGPKSQTQTQIQTRSQA